MIMKGQKINDRYEVIKSIGEGGMANVYLGYDTILDRNVAIKVLRGDLSNDEKFVRRFQREALSASSLAHPNIVEMYDVGEDDGLYYIVMEFIDGVTLKQLLKKRGTLTLSETIDIMLQLTDGMAHAHDSYIIHRDLKPQNIMIKDDGQIKITDFGIAMALNATQLTQTNSVMGSVHYLPPEQASGKVATTKSDIYSMGIIFYELLSGSLPFRGDNAVEIALKHMRDPLPSLRDENPAIPQSIENIIMRSTAKNPKNRYEDTRTMHEDLLTALDDERMNEEPIRYKYPEHEDTPKKKKQDEKNEPELGIDEDLIFRHPFPGPGLGIRVIGEVTKERCDILREADAIYMDILKEEGLYKEIWQAFATLPDVKTVGVMGDERTYAYLVGIRAVTSSDGMTSDWYKMPYDVLEKISNRIVNEVDGANRVVYDITSKPPGTIEWE